VGEYGGNDQYEGKSKLNVKHVGFKFCGGGEVLRNNEDDSNDIVAEHEPDPESGRAETVVEVLLGAS
jgi:hypothetical protein